MSDVEVTADGNKPRRSRKRPGRIGYSYVESDSETESQFALYGAQTNSLADENDLIQTQLETSHLGASTAKHEHISLPKSEHIEEDGRTGQLIDRLVSNEMLYEITVAGLEHLELGSSISVLTEICQARKRKNQLFQKLLELQTERKNLETETFVKPEPK